MSPHPSGKWQKKIRGKIFYFGSWAKHVNGKLTRVEGDGWQDALELYKAQADDLHAGRTPRVNSDGLTVAELCNRFLTAKQRQYEAGEIGARMYKPGPKPELATGEYKATTDRLITTFGKNRLVSDLAGDDFASLRADLAKQFGPVRLGNEIQKVRTVFRYALTQGLINKPVQFGDEFRKPSKRIMRQHRAKTGKRLFEAHELRSVIDDAGMPLKAMILLGINAGFGNADCGHLPQSALDLEGGWVTFPRPKTGIERRAYLWPETVEALKAAIAKCPRPKEEANANLVFITKYGRPWTNGGESDPVSLEMGKLLRKLDLHRGGLGFYALRHTFRTVADATRDFPAVRLVMGHADESMDDVYREKIDDDRLQAVAEHVRCWLFGLSPDGGKATEPATGKPAQQNGSAEQPSTDNDPPVLRLYAG